MEWDHDEQKWNKLKDKDPLPTLVLIVLLLYNVIVCAICFWNNLYQFASHISNIKVVWESKILNSFQPDVLNNQITKKTPQESVITLKNSMKKKAHELENYKSYL